MRIPKKKILFFLIIISTAFCQGSGSESEPYEDDITNRNDFKCRWYGGSSSRVSCDCIPGSEMIIKNNIPSLSTTEIEVNNCKSVTFEPNSVANMRNLRTVRINNVESITFKEEGANWYGYRDNIGNNQGERFDLSIPSIRFHIYNSNVTLISSHAFKGRINEILFDGVVIENILAVAFANILQNEKIVIRNSLLKNIALQSFKKFSVKRIELTNVKADLIPSRTFSDITVFEEVLINNCTFGTVHSGAFSFQHAQIVRVTNNYINHLNGEAFKINSRELVQFINNTINTVDDGAFRGITVDTELTSNPIFTFESNTLSTISRNSLSVMGINAKFSNIFINETCECESIDHKIKDSEYYTDLKCLYNGDYMVIQDFKSNFCSVVSSHYIVIIITSSVLVLLLGIVIGLILYYKMVYRSKKYGGENQKKKGTLSLIVPDGRTYRETELHVVVEKNDLLTTDL